MLKNLRNLSYEELEMLQIFMGQDGKKIKKTKIYDILDFANRETFILFNETNVKALVTLNFDEINYKNIIYAKNILYKEECDIKKLIDLLRKNILIKDSKLIFNLDAEKFKSIFGDFMESYSIVEMEIEIEKINENKEFYNNFIFEHLNPLNKLGFKEIVNESFEIVPNSKTICDEEVQGYIEDINMENEYLFIKENQREIGFVEIKVEYSIAEISLGFIRSECGKNKGMFLLHDIVNYLRKKGVKKMKLFCADNNYRAYKLYKKFGFNKVKIASEWTY